VKGCIWVPVKLMAFCISTFISSIEKTGGEKEAVVMDGRTNKNTMGQTCPLRLCRSGHELIPLPDNAHFNGIPSLFGSELLFDQCLVWTYKEPGTVMNSVLVTWIGMTLSSLVPSSPFLAPLPIPPSNSSSFTTSLTLYLSSCAYK
jgi:hypothetical protein